MIISKLAGAASVLWTPRRQAATIHRHNLGVGSDAKSTRNTGKPWTSADVKQLKELAKGNIPTRVAGLKLGQTEAAVYKKASEEKISLAPTNQTAPRKNERRHT